MRLIDADMLMELARNHVSRAVDCNDIARFPTVDAVPVVHARWKLDRPGHYTCTNCGTFLFGRMAIIMNYCGNCGAYMNGGADEVWMT